MGMLNKFKDLLRSEVEDREMEGSSNNNPNTDLERRLSVKIGIDLQDAKSSKDTVYEDGTGASIEEEWQDEYKLKKGGGLQWSTSLAYRSLEHRKIRPNSEDNFIHNAIHVMTANITNTPPDIRIDSGKNHEEHAKQVNHMVRFNLQRNNFDPMWKEIVEEFVSYGPAIMKVCWDNEWIGGAGPDRFVGEVRLEHVLKEDFFPDPAILDLAKDKDMGRYNAFRKRVSVEYLRERYPDYKKYFQEEDNEDLLVDEGTDPNMADLFEVYYLGFPEFMPEERAKELRERADTQEEQGDYYKANDLRDMAKGDVKGLHLAFYANDMLLEYIPYAYDEPTYPFAFATRYKDTKNQWGYGEIRNIKIPQILHNKADEIELEAMGLEGLGGLYYQDGAITKTQLDNIIENGAKPGMLFAVNRPDQIKERTGIKVPPSIPAYKEHKQRMIETVSSNTPIQQGISPGSSVPFATISELGARADIRTKQASDKLKDFLRDVVKLMIPMFSQFYTEERYYRYVDANDDMQEGSFTGDEIFDTWARETVEEPTLDENGQPMLDETGQPMAQQNEKTEYFIPDFDIGVTILSKKPDDRNYYTTLAKELYQMQILTEEGLLYTLEEGKLPDNEDILQKMYASNQMKALTAQIEQLPEEMREVAMQNMVSALQQTIEGAMSQMQQGQQQMQLPPQA